MLHQNPNAIDKVKKQKLRDQLDGAHGCRRVMCVELSRYSRRCCRCYCRRRRHTPLSYQFFLSILLSVHHFIDFSYEIFIHTHKLLLYTYM